MPQQISLPFNKILKLLIVFIIILPIQIVEATSGACSSHSGVDCARGQQSNGKVYCNDGWTDSMVGYDYMVECQNNSKNLEDLIYKQYYYDGKIVYSMTQSCPLHSQKQYEHSKAKILNDGSLYVPSYCMCDPGYYNYKTGSFEESGRVCEAGEPFVYSMIEAKLSIDEIKDSINRVQRTDKLCELKYGNSFLKNNKCECKDGYRWLYDAYTKEIYCIEKDTITKLGIFPGGIPKNLVLKTDTTYQDTIQREINSTTKINNKLVNRLNGQILLQVESSGEAWYLDPMSKKRYYLKDGPAAYEALRKFGLGITDADLAKIPTEGSSEQGSQTLVNRLKGKILLQVQQHGEAWYINPKDGKRYYLKNGAEAYRIMRVLSLGITNDDIRKIPVGEF